MKILIAPVIDDPKTDSRRFLTENLVRLFSSAGHQTAVSCPQECGIKNIFLCEYTPPQKPFIFFTPVTDRTYEEYMYFRGYLTEGYLSEDTEMLMAVIDEFKPDLVIEIERPSAVIAARLCGVRCWAFVNSAMYIGPAAASDITKGLNTVLSDYKLEQEFSLRNLYARCERRFAFGHPLTESFPASANVTRVSAAAPLFPITGRTNRVCIFLQDLSLSNRKLKKMINDAFLGAPYAVNIWHPESKAFYDRNLHYLSLPKEELIPGASALIHDGNPYYYSIAAAAGVPQMIISSHGYPRNYHAMSLQRNRSGVFLYEEELNMRSLYETYRRLLSDDSFYENTARCRDLIRELPSFETILDYLQVVI